MTADNDSDKRRPILSSERAPHNEKTVAIKLDTKTGLLTDSLTDGRTDRQSQCDFDVDSGLPVLTLFTTFLNCNYRRSRLASSRFHSIVITEYRKLKPLNLEWTPMS
jgi:hypothetical protein